MCLEIALNLDQGAVAASHLPPPPAAPWLISGGNQKPKMHVIQGQQFLCEKGKSNDIPARHSMCIANEKKHAIGCARRDIKTFSMGRNPSSTSVGRWAQILPGGFFPGVGFAFKRAKKHWKLKKLSTRGQKKHGINIGHCRERFVREFWYNRSRFLSRGRVMGKFAKPIRPSSLSEQVCQKRLQKKGEIISTRNPLQTRLRT